MPTKSARTLAPTELTIALTAAVNRAKQTEVDARASRLEAERALKLARGTGDLQAQAAAAVTRSKRGPYFVGDEADTDTSLDAIVRCVSGHGRTLQDVLQMTGIRRTRACGLIILIQRRGLPLKNLGNSQRAIWYLPMPKGGKHNPRTER